MRKGKTKTAIYREREMRDGEKVGGIRRLWRKGVGELRRRNVILYEIAGVKSVYFCVLGLLPCNLLLAFLSAHSLWLTRSTVCSNAYIGS